MNPRKRARLLIILFAIIVFLIWYYIPSRNDKILAITVVACGYFVTKFMLLKKKFAPEKK